MRPQGNEVEVVPADLADRNELGGEIEVRVVERRRQQAALDLGGEAQLVGGALGQGLEPMGQELQLGVLPLQLGQALPVAEGHPDPGREDLVAELAVDEVVGVIDEAGFHVGATALLRDDQHRRPIAAAGLAHRLEDGGQGRNRERAVEDQEVGPDPVHGPEDLVGGGSRHLEVELEDRRPCRVVDQEGPRAIRHRHRREAERTQGGPQAVPG